MANLLWIASERAEGYPLITQVQKKNHKIHLVNSGKDALMYLSTFTCDVIVVDAISLRTSGTRICQSLQRSSNQAPILLITDSPKTEETAAEILVPPFTSRKLINRIKKLLPAKPHNLRHLGQLKLDVELNLVSCNGTGKKKLTPKQTSLLQMLMDHAGEVVTREDLFREVWETDYIGDLRTLDVHISGLRKAIEENMHEPKVLVSVRGVGYQLNVTRQKELPSTQELA